MKLSRDKRKLAKQKPLNYLKNNASNWRKGFEAGGYDPIAVALAHENIRTMNMTFASVELVDSLVTISNDEMSLTALIAQMFNEFKDEVKRLQTQGIKFTNQLKYSITLLGDKGSSKYNLIATSHYEQWLFGMRKCPCLTFTIDRT